MTRQNSPPKSMTRQNSPPRTITRQNSPPRTITREVSDMTDNVFTIDIFSGQSLSTVLSALELQTNRPVYGLLYGSRVYTEAGSVPSTWITNLANQITVIYKPK